MLLLLLLLPLPALPPCYCYCYCPCPCLPYLPATATAAAPACPTSLLLMLQVMFKVDLWRADLVTSVLEVDSAGRVMNEQDLPAAMVHLYPPGVCDSRTPGSLPVAWGHHSTRLHCVAPTEGVGLGLFHGPVVSTYGGGGPRSLSWTGS